MSVIPMQLINCYTLFSMKYREKAYEQFEKNPAQRQTIKKRLLIHNVYLLRMLFDLGFKQHMMQLLDRAFQSKITLESIKALLKVIINGLDSNPDHFFSIFRTDESKKPNIDMTPIKQHLHELIQSESFIFETFFEKAHSKDIDFLKIQLKECEIDTSLSRALEDLIEEFQSNMFYSRYINKLEINQFLLYNINRFIHLGLKHNIEKKSLNWYESYTLFQLIPEFYSNTTKITECLYQALKEFVSIPDNITPSFFSTQSIHIMSILMELLFDEFSDEEKILTLNKIYEFSFSKEDARNIFNQYNQFYDIHFFEILDIKEDLNVDTVSAEKFLHYLARKLFTFDLHQFSYPIYEFLTGISTDPQRKTQYLDNMGTAKRDLKAYQESIKIYQKVIEKYKDTKQIYKFFIAEKNQAYCYYQMGDYQKSEEIFTRWQQNLAQFSTEERAMVYANFAVRYRKIYQFDKEEKYLHLTLESLDVSEEIYSQFLKRQDILLENINQFDGKLDFKRLKELEIQNDFESNWKRVNFHQNRFDLPIVNFFLENAYVSKDKDIEYWKIKAINEILMSNYENLKLFSDEILNFDPSNLFGLFLLSLYHLENKNFGQIIRTLEKIYMYAFRIESKAEVEEKLRNFLCYLFQKLSKSEIIAFFDFSLKESLESKKEFKDNTLAQMILVLASLLALNGESEITEYIYRNIYHHFPSNDTKYLYAGCLYRYEKYIDALNLLLELLAKHPEQVEFLDLTSRVCLELNRFKDCDEYLIRLIDLLKEGSASEKKFKKFRNYCIFLRDSKIRFEHLAFEDVKIVFNTVEHQLKAFNDQNLVEFGNIITEISKGIEIFLGYSFGSLISTHIHDKYPILSRQQKFGDPPIKKPIDKILLKFLQDSTNINPSLGNWAYILNGIKNKMDPKNEIMDEIFIFLSNSTILPYSKLEMILNITGILLDDRNKGTHKKLYKRNEVEVILRKLIPDINQLIQ